MPREVTHSQTSRAKDTKTMPKSEVRIGFVHVDNLFFRFWYYNLVALTKQAHIQVLHKPVNTMAEQEAAITDLIAQGIDVLFIRPIVSEEVSTKDHFRQLKRRGIFVIGLLDEIDASVGVATIGCSNVEGQLSAADLVFKHMGGKGKVAYLRGDMRTETGVLRQVGFDKALSGHPDIRLVQTQTLNWNGGMNLRAQGLAYAHAVIDSIPDLRSIVVASDEAAMGVIEALHARGLSHKVLVSGYDAMPEALLAIEEGRMLATVRQPLDVMAQTAIDIAVSMVQDQTQRHDAVMLPTDLVTQTNLGTAAMRALRIYPQVTYDLQMRSQEQQRTALFLETLLDNMPAMLCVKDAVTLKHLRVSKAGDDWLGVPHGSQLGKSAQDCYPKEVADVFEAEDRAALTAGDITDIAVERSHSPILGDRILHTRKIPLLGPHGRPEYLLSISQDITDRHTADEIRARHERELEEANATLIDNQQRLVSAEKMAALGALVAGVAHELNTPIGNGLLAASTMLDHTRSLQGALTAGLSKSQFERYLLDTQNGANILERNLRKAAELISSFKQIAVDQTTTLARNFSLAQVVSEVLITLSPMLNKTPFVVMQDIPDSIHMTSFPGPLEQVFMNLVNNAVLHGFEGKDKGSIYIAARLVTEHKVELTVSDDGDGIPEDNLKRIYDPFFTTRMGRGGSGLGLSITHNIVTGLLGGHIEVNSSVGEGTCFTMTLPLVAPQLRP